MAAEVIAVYNVRAMLPSGALLHERYRILRPIGRGGMGAVYEALDSRLQNTVAVKQMTVAGPDADRAFENEARLLAALRHSALPVVIDHFVDSGGQFLVMQYIEGEDLARVVEQSGYDISPDDVLRWALAVLDALAYLHTCSPPIVHRDIKPANLKRTPRGEIVLLDFGLAKGRADSQTRLLLEEKSLQGFTLKYAPIEQIEGRGTDPRSDVYALGATLYHLATGLAPPSALQRSAAKRDGLADPLGDAHVVNANVSETFSRVLSRALEFEPARRFKSAVEMRGALLAHAPAPEPLRPQPRPPDDSRRVDAAMPSQPAVGAQTDLIVQVRFAESPLLGLEEWPARQRPSQLEQRSEPVKLSYPRDPVTGSPLPAPLRIKIVAPDFRIEGQAEQLIEVPPDEYSKRLIFFLTPQRAGYCRVNVEVYDQGSFYLGTIPVEAEAVGSGLAQPLLRVANLVLGVFARQVADAMRREAAARAADPIGLEAVQPLAVGAPRAPLFDGDAITGVPGLTASAPAASPQASAQESSVLRDVLPAPKRSGLRRALFIAPVAVIALAIGTDFVLRREHGDAPLVAPEATPPPPTATPFPELPSPVPATAQGPGRGTVAPPSAQPPSVSAPEPSAPTTAPPTTSGEQVVPVAPPAPQVLLPPPAPAPAVPTAPPPQPVRPSAPTIGPPPGASSSPPTNVVLPGPSTATDEAAVLRVLAAYLAAYTSLDANAVRRVFPTVNEQTLKESFSALRTYQVLIQDQRLEMSGVTATVSCTWVAVLTSRIGGTERTSSRILLRLEKVGGDWLIVERR